jgi:hypothetical protein
MLLGLFLSLLVLIVLAIKFSMDLRFSFDDLGVKYVLRLRLGPFFVAVPAKMTARMERMIGNQPLDSVQEVLQDFWAVWRSLDYFLQEIKHFQLEVLFGFGDPFWTALGCGGLWATVGALLSSLEASNRLKETPEVVIQPDYSGVSLQVQLYCIFQFRLGQIIVKELKRLSYAWFA